MGIIECLCFICNANLSCCAEEKGRLALVSNQLPKEGEFPPRPQSMHERDIAVQSLRMAVARGDIGFLRQQDPRSLVEWRGTYAHSSYSHRKHGSLLHVAAWHRRDDIARFLLDNGANINAVDAQKKTPLHLAVNFDSVAMVSLLLSRGADAEGRCRSAGSAYCQLEETPLSEAVTGWSRAHVTIARLLMHAGADPNVVGLSPGQNLLHALLYFFFIAQWEQDKNARTFDREDLKKVMEIARLFVAHGAFVSQDMLRNLLANEFGQDFSDPVWSVWKTLRQCCRDRLGVVAQALNDFCGDGHSDKKVIEKLVRVISHMEGSSKCERMVLAGEDLAQ